jgi:hypothetical protein
VVTAAGALLRPPPPTGGPPPPAGARCWVAYKAQAAQITATAMLIGVARFRLCVIVCVLYSGHGVWHR